MQLFYIFISQRRSAEFSQTETSKNFELNNVKFCFRFLLILASEVFSPSSVSSCPARQ